MASEFLESLRAYTKTSVSPFSVCFCLLHKALLVALQQQNQEFQNTDRCIN